MTAAHWFGDKIPPLTTFPICVVIPGWFQRVGAFAPPDDRLRTRPQTRNCASGNLEIPGSRLRTPRN